jgi:hypothetical protein
LPTPRGLGFISLCNTRGRQQLIETDRRQKG